MAKAFDRIWHDRPIYKPVTLDYSKVMTKVMDSYNRKKLRVKFEHKISTKER